MLLEQEKNLACSLTRFIPSGKIISKKPLQGTRRVGRQFRGDEQVSTVTAQSRECDTTTELSEEDMQSPSEFLLPRRRMLLTNGSSSLCENLVCYSPYLVAFSRL